MSSYYNKEGHSITLEEWGKLLENLAYKRVAETTLKDGRWISTVWLGLDHNFNNPFSGEPTEPPLIFETMVFTKGDGGECERYSTLEEAKAGHEAMVKKLSTVQPLVDKKE